MIVQLYTFPHFQSVTAAKKSTINKPVNKYSHSSRFILQKQSFGIVARTGHPANLPVNHVPSEMRTHF